MEEERGESSEKPLDMEQIKQRKEELMKKAKEKKSWLIYGAMLIIAWFGYHIRTLNLPLLNGKWIPDVDSYAFLRYAEYIVEHGKMMAFDTLRYFPFGFDPTYEFGFLSYVIAYLYKILHFINPSATVVDAAIYYPPLAFFGAAVFFFLFVKKLFNWKVAMVSTGFLAVLPPFLYRTMAGVADKEALAIMFFFATLYFFVLAINSDKIKKITIYSVVAGLLTAVMGAIWGGVSSLFLSLGAYAIIASFFQIFKKKQIYAYIIWTIVTLIFLTLFYPTRYTFQSYLTSLTTQVMLFGLLTCLGLLLIKNQTFSSLKAKVEERIPLGLFSFLFATAIGVIAVSIISGPDFIFGAFKNLYSQMSHAFGETRWSLTVAENKQPYFTDWISQMSWKYILLFMGGAILFFYESLKKINKNDRWKATIIFGAFIFLFTMSRYSPNSIFDGISGISKIAYFGSLLGFFGIIVYAFIKSYYRNKSLFDKVKNIDSLTIFLIVWFIIMTVAARSAVRLLFIFAPVTAVLVGYFTIKSIKKIMLIKNGVWKIVGLIIILFVVGSTFVSFTKNSMAQASYVGPSYNTQWQNAMAWARENTPEDAVFAHWWDYGYWVQWGANRATISDGGNAFGGINHFVGRHVLTGQSETEALEFLKARNVSYLLMIKEEIGKYPAFSSIGADENYDRYSWISTFRLKPEQTRETRNETLLFFGGGTPLDDDLIYKDQLFPAQSSGIGAFIVPMRNVEVESGNETQTVQEIGQPRAIVVYNGIQEEIPLKCVYYQGEEKIFDDGETLEGCLRILPEFINQQQINPLGGALYLSPDVYKGMFAKLFLLNHESEYFKLAYSDENKGMPLALYQGRLVGPIKIWEVNYPNNLTIPEEYYHNKLPDPKVKEVR